MSIAAMNYVDESAEGMASGRFFVLYRLANRASDHSGEDWSCFPSIKVQAADTHLSRSAVERHLADLVGEGWISRKRRIRPDGNQGIYDYWIHRSPERRAALKEARRRIREAGQKIEETLADLDHPCCKMLHGQCGELQHGPCGDLGHPMLQNEGDPCGKSPPQEHSLEPKDNPQGVREPGDDGFEALIEIWPASGAKRTRWPAARANFAKACDEVEAAVLVGLVRACAADPEMAKGDHGWPGLHTWLGDERWRAYLRRAGADGVAGLASGERIEAEASSAFALPPELAAQLLSIEGVATYLHRAGWSEADRTILAATGVARDRLLERIGRRRLAELQINIARAPAP